MHYALGDYVLDIAQNAVEAGSTEVSVDLAETDEETSVAIADNGCGMSEEEIRRALDPFYTDGKKHAARRVGLGLPFLRQATEQAKGTFSIVSEKGKGTRVAFSFPRDNVDSPPLEELPGLFLSLLCLPGEHELVIRRTKDTGGRTLRYELSRRALSEAAGGLERGDSLALLREYLASQEEED
jgi:hypothetical protein